MRGFTENGISFAKIICLAFADIEIRIQTGNRALYDKQYAKYKQLVATDERVKTADRTHSSPPANLRTGRLYLINSATDGAMTTIN